MIGAILTTLSLTAYAYMNWGQPEPEVQQISCAEPVNESIVSSAYGLATTPANMPLDFVFSVDNRFVTTITLNQLQNAKSIIDILPDEATETLSEFREVKVDTLPNNYKTAIEGVDETLNQDQLDLLQSTGYSSNFYLESKCKNQKTRKAALENYHLVYYLTVVPEKAATYPGGQNSVANYLEKNSEEQMASIEWAALRPGKVSFTVTKKGTISQVRLNSTCGTPSFDKHVIELIKTLPNQWEPATNAKGQQVHQEFVFFYGQKGC